MIVLDDVALDPGQVECLLGLLAGGSLVLASQRPAIGRHGISLALTGLPDDAAVELVIAELGRPLTGEELAPVRRLIAAVDGQPLHLRQAAALIREQGMTPERIAGTAERDPAELDRLSINELAGFLGRRPWLRPFPRAPPAPHLPEPEPLPAHPGRELTPVLRTPC